MSLKKTIYLSCSCGTLMVFGCRISLKKKCIRNITVTLFQSQIYVFFVAILYYFARPFPNSSISWFLPPARNNNPNFHGNNSIFDGLVFTRGKAAVILFDTFSIPPPALESPDQGPYNIQKEFVEKKWGPRGTHRWRCLLGFSLSKASREFKKINQAYLKLFCL